MIKHKEALRISVEAPALIRIFKLMKTIGKAMRVLMRMRSLKSELSAL